MFDAARAAILASGASVEPEVARWATGQAEVFIQTVNADFLCSASDGAMVRLKLSLQRILFAGTDQSTVSVQPIHLQDAREGEQSAAF